MASPMPSMSAASSAKSGDIHGSASFMSGDFIVGGGKFDLGAMTAQYWPLLLIGAGVLWYMRKKR